MSCRWCCKGALKCDCVKKEAEARKDASYSKGVTAGLFLAKAIISTEKGLGELKKFKLINRLKEIET